MKIEIQIIGEPIPAPRRMEEFSGSAGALAEFYGNVRGQENGQAISALEYEAYSPMAENEIRRILESLAETHPCLGATVIHRIGVIPAGETAIYIGVAAKHRGEAFALLMAFMDRLKLDVPIWKRRGLAKTTSDAPGVPGGADGPQYMPGGPGTARPALRSLDEAMAEIYTNGQSLPAVRTPLDGAWGRVLREAVHATEDLPPFDCSTRDGFAVLAEDASESFQVVDTIHADGWQPRQLKPGEAVRVATGAPLPGNGLRVVMQENVRRIGEGIKLVINDRAANIRYRGQEAKAGQILVPAGVRLDAGKLALLATAGWGQPLVSPRVRVAHFTTGDELVPPGHTPKPGQIHDSNSIFIRSLLQNYSCDVTQQHLPENFSRAQAEISHHQWPVSKADVILISGGASVGEKDFTGPLLTWLGFDIVFSQVNVRPGKPLIFGRNGARLAFGLPGNPLAHFACFHFAIATALARLTGTAAPEFLRGKLAANLDDPPCPRETLWPARLDFAHAEINLHPLAWASSGDPTCLTAANALIRVPANAGSLAAGAEVDFLAASGMLAER